VEASITGESEAVVGNVPGPAAFGDRQCMVYKGTAVARGSGRAIVTATGRSSDGGCRTDLLPGQGCERGLLHAVTVPVQTPPASGAPGWHGPAFSKIRRAYVTVPEYGRAVVDVSGSAATPRVLRASRIIC
jgi:magnesium-transporting ATPase (P-type)